MRANLVNNKRRKLKKGVFLGLRAVVFKRPLPHVI